MPVNQLINTQFSSTTTTTNVKGIIWGNLPQIENVGPLTKLRIINMWDAVDLKIKWISKIYIIIVMIKVIN